MKKKELNIAIAILSILVIFAVCQTVQLHFLNKSKDELKAHIAQKQSQSEFMEREQIEI